MQYQKTQTAGLTDQIRFYPLLFPGHFRWEPIAPEGDNVRMLQLTENVGFTKESIHRILPEAYLGDDRLQGHVAPIGFPLRLVHDPHGAAP